MTGRATDLEKLRLELRRLPRGDLLIIAERATELVSKAKLKSLLGDYVLVDTLAETRSRQMPLLEEVQTFHRASLGGRYFESFSANSGNFMERSRGTDTFIAEFVRLLGRCVRAADTEPRKVVREAFELLFGLLRHLDEAHDDVIFFADEGGSHQIGINWRAAFPAYFRCLTETASPEEFSTIVDQAITAFADHERPLHLKTACKVASAAQQTALCALTAGR
jgi:hypothetical protein